MPYTFGTMTEQVLADDVLLYLRARNGLNAAPERDALDNYNDYRTLKPGC